MLAKRAVAVLVSVALAGCATSSKNISTTYVSPNQYAVYDCPALAAEASRIQTRVVALGGRLDEAAMNDAGIMAVGLLIFWPVLFALGGTKQQEAEYGRLKGEYDAVEQAAIMKKCTHAVNTQTATAPAAAPAPMQSAPTAAAPSPLPVATAAAIPVSAPMSTPSAAPSVAGMKAESKYLIQAEGVAKVSDCEQPQVVMTSKGAGSEMFAAACSSGVTLAIRCEVDGCRVLR